MRSISYNQAKQLKDNGIEIPDSEVTGWYCKSEQNGIYTNKKEPQFLDHKSNLIVSRYNWNKGCPEGVQFLDQEEFDKCVITATNLEGLWNMLPKEIIILSCRYKRTITRENRLSYANGVNNCYGSYDFDNPCQAIIDMLVFLKKEEVI
jgi:hypothetical protein